MNYYTPKLPESENEKNSRVSHIEKNVESLHIKALNDFLVSNQRPAQILPEDFTIIKTIAKGWLSMDRVLTNVDMQGIFSANISADARAILGIILFNINNERNEATKKPQKNTQDRVKDIF